MNTRAYSKNNHVIRLFNFNLEMVKNPKTLLDGMANFLSSSFQGAPKARETGYPIREPGTPFRKPGTHFERPTMTDFFFRFLPILGWNLKLNTW